MAILSLISGVLLTTVSSDRPAVLFASLGSRSLLVGVLLALLVGASTGVDFPG